MPWSSVNRDGTSATRTPGNCHPRPNNGPTYTYIISLCPGDMPASTMEFNGLPCPSQPAAVTMLKISLSHAISPKGRVRFVSLRTCPRPNAILARPRNCHRISVQWPRGFRTGQRRNIPEQETTEDDGKVPQPPPEKETQSTRPVVVDANGKKYYSLKDYREGPNPESGELGKDYDSEDVRTHNRDVDDRHKRD